MTNEDRQRQLLLAQLNQRRAMKQKYLYQPEETGNAPGNALTELVMTNVMLYAIKARVDIFGAIRRLRGETDPNGAMRLGTALGWLQSLAEVLDCSVYELFVDDASKRRRILDKLLRELEPCDSWANIRLDEQGNGSFSLPGFDYAYRMAEQPSATLLFERTALAERGFRYTLTLGDGRSAMGLIPSQAVLWQENQGPLQAFTDRILTEYSSGWGPLKEQFDQIRQQLLAEAEKLRDLTALLDEVPGGIHITPLLAKEAERLRALRTQEKAVHDQIPAHMKRRSEGSQNTLILLGGAISALERMLNGMPDVPQEQLAEIVYMLENAGQPL